MKYLKKFESKSSFEDDIESFFIEFEEDGLVTIVKDEYAVYVTYYLDITSESSLEEKIKNIGNSLESLKDLKVAIDRLKDEYKDSIIINQEIRKDIISLSIVNNNVVNKGEFYIKKGNKIILVEKDFKKVFGLDKNISLHVVKVSGGSEGTYNMLSLRINKYNSQIWLKENKHHFLTYLAPNIKIDDVNLFPAKKGRAISTEYKQGVDIIIDLKLNKIFKYEII